MTRLLVAWYTSGSCFQPVVVLYLVTSRFGLLYLKRVALRCLTLFIPGSWSAWIAPVQALLLFIWMMCLWAPPDWHARLPNFHCYCEIQLWWIAGSMRTARYRAHWRSAAFTTRCWRGCESRGLVYSFAQQGCESVSLFHLFHLFIDWSKLVGPLVLVCCLGVFCLGLFVCGVSDQSLWSSRLTMTTLAQLHDCHSCNDERSIVQKKAVRTPLWALVLCCVCYLPLASLCARSCHGWQADCV